MLLNDLRYTARMLRKSPLFTLAVVLTVALGIGANTAIFSVVNAVMLRPLPFEQPDRLVWIAEKNDKLNLPTFAASVLNYLSWKEQSRTFDPLAAFGFASFNLTGQGDPEQFTGGTHHAVAVSAARHQAGPRASVPRRRGPARQRAGRDDQRGAVEAALRRRPGDRRPQPDAERHRHHRRRHRAGVAGAAARTATSGSR